MDAPAATPPATAGRGVHAPLTFMVKGGRKPYIETEALTRGEAPRTHAELEEREVAIADARPLGASLSLDREGIQFMHRATAVADLYDEKAIRRDYYAEVEALIKQATGACRVVIFDHTHRVDGGHAQGGPKRPASRVHNDYTDASGPQRVRDVLGAEQATALADTAVAQINLWRPVRGPVLRSPLALLDAASVDPDDLLATDMHYPGRIGEIYHLAYNRHQRWLYFPAMVRDELVLIKGYDSRTDGRARFTPHSAFTDPNTRPEDAPRESIEVRTLAIFAGS